MPAPTFQSVVYTDPAHASPPGTLQWGVMVTTPAAAVPPATPYLAACLMQIGQPLTYSIGVAKSGTVLVPVTSSLGSGLSYQILAQWTTVGTDPKTLSWITNPGTIASAPVVVQRLGFAAGMVGLNTAGTIASLSFLWETDAGTLVPGAYVKVFDSNNKTAGTSTPSPLPLGTIATIPIVAATNYWAYAIGLQSLAASGFVAPYSLGPASNAFLLPITSPTLGSVAYDGVELSVTWQPAAQLNFGTGSSRAAYWLQLISGGKIVGSFAATSSGAKVAASLTPDVSIAGAISIGPFTGPSSTPQPLIARAPVIASVQLAPDSKVTGNTAITVTVTPPPSLPTGATLQVQLVQNGVAGTPVPVTGTPFSAIFSAPLSAGSTYSVQAYATSGTGVTVTGPLSVPCQIVPAAPTIAGVSYDGRQLAINWTQPAGAAVTGYCVTLTGALAGNYTTGPATSLVVPAALAPSAAVSVVVTPLGTGLIGLASQSQAYTVPALGQPGILATVFDGQVAVLEWSPSAGPGLDSYAVKISGVTDSGTPGPVNLVFFTGLTPSLKVALPCDVPRTWSARVTPLAGDNNGPGSAAATFLTAVATINALTVAAGTATVSWALTGVPAKLLSQLTAGASVEVMILDGAQMLASNSAKITAASGQLTVALPVSISGRLTAVTQISLGNQLGPRSGAVAVLSTAPVITSAGYDGRWLALGWSGGGLEGVLGYTVVLTPATGTALAFTAGPESLLQVTANLNLGTPWTATVQPFGANTTGLASAGVSVILPAALAAPVVRVTAFDGELLFIDWDQAQLPYLTGYGVTITPVTGTAISLLTGPETNLTWPSTPIAAAGATITVTGRSALRTSPVSAAVTVIAVSPVITAVSVGALDITVTWSVTPPDGTTASVELLDGDTVVATVAGSAISATIPLAALGSASRYRVRGFLGNGVARGPDSGAVAVLTQAPGIGSASYDGQWLTVDWCGKGLDGVLGYLVTLVPAAGDAIILAAGPETLLQTTCNLDLGTTWTVLVQPFGANTTGVASASFNVVLPPVAAPALRSAIFDGDWLTLEWDQAQLPYLTGYGVTITPGTGSAFSLLGGPATARRWPLAPAQAAGATVAVTGLSVLLSSPASAPITTLAAAPVISAVTIDGAVNIAWSTGTLPAGATTVAELLDGDTVIATKAGTAASASFPLATMTAGCRFRVRGHIVNGIARGPDSGAVAVLTVKPVIGSAAYDGRTLTLNWNSGGQDGVLGYIVTLTPATGSTLTFTTGPESLFAVNCTLDLTTTWQVTLQPFGANASGIVSGTANIVLPALAAPVIQSARFDGEELTLDWNQAQLPYLTGYGVTITPGTGSAFSLFGGPETTLRWPLTPEQATGATVVVTGLSALRSSPASAAITTFALAPLVTAVAVDATNINVVWSVSLPTGAATTAEWLDGDTVVATTAGTATGASMALADLGAGQRYRVRGFVRNGAVRGPDSGAVELLTFKPIIGAASYDGQWLTVNWTGSGQDGVLGYTVTLTPATGTAVTFSTGPETLLQVTVNLNLGTTWTAAVQSFGANTLGPPSATATVVPVSLAAPAINLALFDGAALALEWTPATLPDLTGYLVSLTPASGTPLTISCGSETILRWPLPPATVAGATITVTGLAAYRNSPPSPVVTAIALTPLITAVAVDAANITVTWSAPLPTGASATAELLDGDTVIAITVGTATGASFALTALGAGQRYRVRGFVSNAASRGPDSGAVAVLATKPVIGSVVYDGQWLTLGWSGGGLDGVLGYAVTLTPGTGTAITLTVGSETRLQTACNLDLGTTWSATVQAFGANTTSAVSAATNIGCPPMAAPVVRSAAFDGEQLAVEWDQAELPYLAGSGVTITPGVGSAVTLLVGPETNLTWPLTPEEAAGAAITVIGRSAMRTSPASEVVTVIAAAPVIIAVRVNLTAVTIAWSVTLPAGTIATAELLDGDTVVASASGTITGANIPLTTLGPGYRYRVRGFLRNGTARGPNSGAVAVLVQAPSAVFAALAGNILSLRWLPAPAAGVTGYSVTYGKTGDTPTTIGTSDTTLAQPLAWGDLAPGIIQLSALGANTASPAASIDINFAYAVASGSYDGAQVKLTLTAGTGNAPAQLWIDVLSNGALAARMTVPGSQLTGITVPVALPPGLPATVQLTGVGATTVTVPSLPTALPTTSPLLQSAVYDGTNLHVAWTPVSDPGLTGYLVTIAGTASPVTPRYVAGNHAASVIIPATFALPISAAAQVTIQASNLVAGTNRIDGPSSAPLTPTLANYLRTCAVKASAQPPYLYRRGQFATLGTVSAANVVAFLPNPLTGAATPTIPPGSDQPFQLIPTTAPGATLGYSLTIDQSVWTSFGADAVRSTWRDAYRAFLVAVEQAGVQPWAIPLLQQIIAEAMPQTFAETLFYRYGLWRDASLRVVDLKPGLRLHLSAALYQLVASQADTRNGFVASGSDDYDLSEVIAGTGTAPSRLLSADTFLSLLFPGGRTCRCFLFPAPRQCATYPTAGPMDFFQTNAPQTYFRLFYPGDSYPASGSIGSADVTANIALVGAPSWKALEDVTDFYAQKGFFPPSGSYFSTYFRGRATVTPLLDVNFAGGSRWLPLGTTLRQLLTGQGLAPFFGESSGNVIGLARPVANLFDQNFGGPALRYEPVNLAGGDFGGFAPALWPLDLPLLSGDAVTINAGTGST